MKEEVPATFKPKPSSHYYVERFDTIRKSEYILRTSSKYNITNRSLYLRLVIAVILVLYITNHRLRHWKLDLDFQRIPPRYYEKAGPVASGRLGR